MAHKNKKKVQSAKIILCIFVAVIILLIANIVYLGATGKHFISGNDIAEYASTHGGKQKIETLYAKRGTIYSSDDEVLASDVTKYKLYAVLNKERVTADNEPAYVVNVEETAEKLAPIIGMDEEKIIERLKQASYQVEFGSYGNNLSSIVKDQIVALNLPGLEFVELTTRNYRYGDFASYEIGYATSITDETSGSTEIVGQLGLEKALDDQLKGINGQRVYLADRQNYTLPNGVLSETAPQTGNDVYLTIDTDIQTELNLQMQKLVEAVEADKATCAVMEAKTGRILAVNNYPSFDPNKRDLENYIDLFLNEPVECGSVFKSFVYANALTDGKLDIKSTFPSGHYYYKVNGKVIADIKDHNKVGWGQITYETGFYYSSNTAICNMLTKLVDKESLIQSYEDLGLYQESHVDGLTSAAGVAGFKREGDRTLEYLTTGFGQGSTITAFQLLRGYSAFANEGKMVEPHFIDKIVDSETDKVIYEATPQYSKQIYSNDAVDTMRYLLSGVVNGEGNTGFRFKMDDINLIAKTGTGQVAKDGKYMSNYYTHSFAGLAPYDDPQVVVVFWYQAPQANNVVAAEMVSAVVRASLNKINAQPTKEVETSTFVLDTYMNQSVDYVKNILTEHQLTPLFIGDGKTVIEQYPKSKTEVSSKSRVFLLTNGSKITMPSMKGWSRKDAEAFASMANIKLTFEGVGTIYEQSVSKGTTLKQDQEVTVKAK